MPEDKPIRRYFVRFFVIYIPMCIVFGCIGSIDGCMSRDAVVHREVVERIQLVEVSGDPALMYISEFGINGPAINLNTSNMIPKEILQNSLIWESNIDLDLFSNSEGLNLALPPEPWQTQKPAMALVNFVMAFRGYSTPEGAAASLGDWAGKLSGYHTGFWLSSRHGSEREYFTDQLANASTWGPVKQLLLQRMFQQAIDWQSQEAIESDFVVKYMELAKLLSEENEIDSSHFMSIWRMRVRWARAVIHTENSPKDRLVSSLQGHSFRYLAAKDILQREDERISMAQRAIMLKYTNLNPMPSETPD